MKRKTSVLSLLLVSVFGFSQNLLWQKSYGGTGNEFSSAIQSASNSRFVVVGSTDSPETLAWPSGTIGMKDFLLMNLDDNGTKIYSVNFGGTENDEIFSVVEHSFNVTLAGSTNSTDNDVTGNHGAMDAWVVNYYNGAVTWKYNYGGTRYDHISCLKKTADGGFVFVGFTESSDGDLSFKTNNNTDAWVVKLSSAGAVQWQKVLVGNPSSAEIFTVANAVEQTSDGGYILTGTTQKTVGNLTDTDIWTARLDSAGNTVWSVFFGDPENSDQGEKVMQTSDGGFLVMGSSTIYNAADHANEIKIRVAKLTSDGTMAWQQTYGDSFSTFGRGMMRTSDGHFVIVGDTYSDANNYRGSDDYDFYVLKISEAGALQWQNKYGGSALDRAYAVAEANDGNYVVVGSTNSTDGDVTVNNGGFDIWTIKLSKN